jgi:N-hydroxyarylamine O-acetyltransferase
VQLSAYLNRIRFVGTPRCDLETLRALHRAHQYAVPFENVDVQLRRPVVLDVAPSYDKIVNRGRGGWCYEMNGVMGWALREIGFEVMRMSAGVMRASDGDAQLGNHLCLLVSLDQPYLVDVGFGGTMAEPLPLRTTRRDDAPYRLALDQIDDGYWRFGEQALSDLQKKGTDLFSAAENRSVPFFQPFTFDFRVAPADEALLAAKCEDQQTNPDSPFIKNLVVQRRTPETHVSLRGRVLSISHASHVDKRVLNSADELVASLHDHFDLDIPEAATLWPDICARHEAVFGAS